MNHSRMNVGILCHIIYLPNATFSGSRKWPPFERKPKCGEYQSKPTAQKRVDLSQIAPQTQVIRKATLSLSGIAQLAVQHRAAQIREMRIYVRLGKTPTPVDAGVKYDLRPRADVTPAVGMSENCRRRSSRRRPTAGAAESPGGIMKG